MAPNINIIKPFFNITGGSFLPEVSEENARQTEAVERYDHIAASGKRQSYLVGSRMFRDVTFRWQDSTQTALWETFWSVVKGGKTFLYMDDDTCPIAATTLNCGTGIINGNTITGAALVTKNMVMEDTEMTFDEEEIYGYWSVTIRMREAV